MARNKVRLRELTQAELIEKHGQERSIKSHADIAQDARAGIIINQARGTFSAGRSQ
jgi:hypothetical protein